MPKQERQRKGRRAEDELDDAADRDWAAGSCGLRSLGRTFGVWLVLRTVGGEEGSGSVRAGEGWVRRGTEEGGERVSRLVARGQPSGRSLSPRSLSSLLGSPHLAGRPGSPLDVLIWLGLGPAGVGARGAT